MKSDKDLIGTVRKDRSMDRRRLCSDSFLARGDLAFDYFEANQ